MGFVDNIDKDEPIVLPDGSELDFSGPDPEEAVPEAVEAAEAPDAEADEPVYEDDGGAEEAPRVRRAASASSVLITIVAAIIGTLVGALPAVIGALVFGDTIAFLFLCLPICICLAIALLHGCRDWRALVVTIVFSLLGMYYVAVSCKAAVYVVDYGMSLLNIPLVTATQLGNADIFSGVGPSAFIFPFIFTGLGVAISWLTLNKTGVPED